MRQPQQQPAAGGAGGDSRFQPADSSSSSSHKATPTQQPQPKYFTSDECCSQRSSSSQHSSSGPNTERSQTVLFERNTRTTGTCTGADAPLPPVPAAVSECWVGIDSSMRQAAAATGYALQIGKYPLVFLAVPLVLVCLAAGPFIDSFTQFLKNSKQGSVDLFLPDNLRSAATRNQLSNWFPDGGYFSNRDFLAENLLIAIVWSKQKLSVFHPVFVREYARLRSELDNTAYKLQHPDLDVPNGNNTHSTYARVCAKHQGTHCRPDAYLALWHAMSVSRDSSGSIPPPRLTFPVVQMGGRGIYVGALFGDVHLNGQGAIVHATYVRMIFDLPPELGPVQMAAFGDAWVTALRRINSSLVDVVFWNPRHYLTDLAQTGQRSRRWVPLLAAVLVLFSAVSCCMVDVVLSKPWLAVGGVLSAGCGIVCSHAILHLLRVELIQIAMIVPFLVLSIGVDDTFVMLNVWRKSDRRLSVPERLRDTYSEAAVSISITTLTDASVFAVGIFSTFPAIRVFCAHCFLAIIVVFAFQLIMFGALLALSGYREHQHRHALTFCKIPKGPYAPALFGLTSCLSTRPWQNVYFGVWHTRLLQTYAMQAVLLVSYVLYVCASVWSISRLQVGLQTYHLVPYDTDTYAYSRLYDQHFTRYSTAAELAVSGPIDLHNLRTRYELLDIVNLFERTAHTLPSTHFWLRDFLLYIEPVQQLDRQGFYDLLINKFLQQPAFSHYKEDIVIEESAEEPNSHLVRHMRLFIPLVYMDTHNRSRAMHLLTELARDVNKHHPNMNTLIYDVSFPLAEQYDAIGRATVQNMCVAGLAMLVIALLFIPNIMCCIAVSLTVLSINVGVLGLLCLLGVSLDIISNITILLSIGFSVDFSSHIAYHFHHSKGVNAQQRLSNTLETVGWPIMQSSLSTLLGVLTLIGIQSYISATFVKTVVLVMLVGVYHGLFLLPLLLCAIERHCCARVLHASLPRRKVRRIGGGGNKVGPPPPPQQDKRTTGAAGGSSDESIYAERYASKPHPGGGGVDKPSQISVVSEPPSDPKMTGAAARHHQLPPPHLQIPSPPPPLAYCSASRMAQQLHIDPPDCLPEPPGNIYTQPHTPNETRPETFRELNYATTTNTFMINGKLTKFETMLF